MKRIQFQRFTIPDSEVYHSAIEFMIARSFPSDSGDGFTISEATDDHVVGLFTETVNIERKFLMPSGNEQTLQYTDFRFTSFEFLQGSSVFIIRDSPRSLKKFYSALSRAFRHSLAFSDVDLNLSELLVWLEESNIDFAVSAVRVSGVVFHSAVTATILLSGAKYLLETGDELMKLGESGRLDAVTLRLRNELGVSRRIDVFSSGLLRTNSEIDDSICSLFVEFVSLKCTDG